MKGGPLPETVTTFNRGHVRLAYCASSTPDMSPARFTSVTSARSSVPVETSTSSAAAALAHSTTFETLLFEQVGQKGPLQGVVFHNEAIEFNMTASGLFNSGMALLFTDARGGCPCTTG